MENIKKIIKKCQERRKRIRANIAEVDRLLEEGDREEILAKVAYTEAGACKEVDKCLRRARRMIRKAKRLTQKNKKLLKKNEKILAALGKRLGFFVQISPSIMDP